MKTKQKRKKKQAGSARKTPSQRKKTTTYPLEGKGTSHTGRIPQVCLKISREAKTKISR